MNTNDSEENEEETENSEQFEQLLRANEQLKQQLLSLTSLSASLAQQQAGDTLVWFGAGIQKRWVNARSIRLVSLQEGLHLGSYEQMGGPSGTFAVAVDEMVVSSYLPPEEAETALDEVAAVIIRALQPPE